MPDTTPLLPQFYIKIDGTDVKPEMMAAIEDIVVESSLHLPDAATISLHDNDGKWVDEQTLAPGKAIEMTAKVGDVEAKVFDGEIVEIESDFVPGHRKVHVRAFDRMHRLSRGRAVRSYVQMTDGDIVQKIASDVGLSPKIGDTPTVHDYVLQDNVTNLEFLRQRASGLGFLIYVDSKDLHFEAPGTSSTEIDLTLAEGLLEFHPRLTMVDQVNGVKARGWDPAQRQAVIGQATNGHAGPKLGLSGTGGSIAQSAFGAAELLVADRPIRTQAVADKLAQATLDRRDGRFVEADGIAVGTPPLKAGLSVKLSNLGARFSGTYYVTSTSHKYNVEAGYTTHFTVSGLQPATLINLLAAEHDGAPPPRFGLVIGVVTNNLDPEGLCRVKVKFPWLADQEESDWARVISPGGGPQRGLEFIPEVNDEVVVGFEHGDINYPYVLGGLWNGQDAPPKKSSEATVLSGSNKDAAQVKQRIIRSRTGHIITLDDSEDQPSISIVDKTEKNLIKFDSKTNKLTVHFEGDMLFEAPSGDISIKSKTITMESTDAFKMKGMSVNAEATQAFNIKGMNTTVEASAGANVKGATAKVEASAQLSLSGSAMAELKGGIVKIN